MNKGRQFRERLDALAASPHETALRVVNLELDRAELVAALRELVRVDDLPGMAAREWDAAIDNVRALLARIEVKGNEV